MSDPKLFNPLRQLKDQVTSVHDEWNTCWGLFEKFRGSFRQWVDEHDKAPNQRVRNKMNSLCDFMVQNSPIICIHAVNVKSSVIQVRGNVTVCMTYYENHKDQFKGYGWGRWLTAVKTDMENFWNIFWEPNKEKKAEWMINYVKDTARHCKEMTAAPAPGV